MKAAAAAASLLTASLCGRPCHLTPPVELPIVSRRAALAAAGLAAVGLPAYAAQEGVDDKWTLHEGPFTDEFFEGFTVSKAESSFKYKFVREGDGGKKPAPLQKVSVNYRGCECTRRRSRCACSKRC